MTQAVTPLLGRQRRVGLAGLVDSQLRQNAPGSERNLFSKDKLEWQGDGLLHMPDNLSSVPETHVQAEGSNGLHKVSSDLHMY